MIIFNLLKDVFNRGKLKTHLSGTIFDGEYTEFTERIYKYLLSLRVFSCSSW